ncbi:MAG: Lrp/AsnC family transcriptional regulator [Pseudomonadales bacterium]
MQAACIIRADSLELHNYDRLNEHMAQEYIELDRIDRSILHQLQLDAKLANQALAALVNLSESACLRRVRRLEEAGMLRGYVGLVDQSMAGYPDNVFVQITLTSQQQNDLAAFEAEVREIPEVMECYLMSGAADYILRVIVEDARDYERVHSQHLTRLPGVARVNSNFSLRTVIKKTEIPIRAQTLRSGRRARDRTPR